MARKVTAQDWLRLQKKIFGRWVAQRVMSRGQKITDITKDLSSGIVLVALLEELSGLKNTLRINPNPRMRAIQIDNVNNALKFTWTCGVEMKIKPSAEDLVDGNEKNILGFIWAIMLKFIKIEDEDDDSASLDAKEALLLWCRNKTHGYDGVNIVSFNKSFQDGLALCAIVHKHRPHAIGDFGALSASDHLKNIDLAMTAAEKHFGLDKYLEPRDIAMLDDKGMMVFVCDFYYSIAEARKMDLAARRIGKVIKLTVQNDEQKKEFEKVSVSLSARMIDVEKVLGDRTVDNTLAGAKRRLEEFYEYKKGDKNLMIGEQLDLEGIYNQLAMRLAQHKRPEFVPRKGCSLKEVEENVSHMEGCEMERQGALNDELNRQIRLRKLDERHTKIFQQLSLWKKEKEEYLRTKEVVTSIGEAELQLRLLEAFNTEMEATKSFGLDDMMSPLSKELSSESYELLQEVNSREKKTKEDIFDVLNELSSLKRPVLDDNLTREQFREKVRLMNLAHVRYFDFLKSWFQEKEDYLKTKVEVKSVPEAKGQLSLLDAFVNDKRYLEENNVSQLQALGSDIKAQHYKTEYSEWRFETPDEIESREKDVAEWLNKLAELTAEKNTVLDDDLARESFAEKVSVMELVHKGKYNQLVSWAEEKKKWLQRHSCAKGAAVECLNCPGTDSDIGVDPIEGVPAAQEFLKLLHLFEHEKSATLDNDVADLKKRGEEILAQEYKSDLSSYQWDDGETKVVSSRPMDLETRWKELDVLSSKKKKHLEDHLERANFIENVKTMNLDHLGKFKELVSWTEEKEVYLKKHVCAKGDGVTCLGCSSGDSDVIDNLPEAEKQISLIQSYENDKQTKNDLNVAQMKDLGQDILSQKYESEYSLYKWELPEEIKERANTIDNRWETLSNLSAAKRKVLDDSLVRENLREKVRVMNLDHLSKYEDLSSWVGEKEEYLKKHLCAQGDAVICKDCPKSDDPNTYDPIDSVPEAEKHISIWQTYENDKKMKTDASVPQLKNLGQDILSQKHESEYSQYVWERPDEIKERGAFVDQKWIELDDLSKARKLNLDDHFAREKFRGVVRQMDADHFGKHEDLCSWIQEKRDYLTRHTCARGAAVECLKCPGESTGEDVEVIQSVPDATTALSILELYHKEKENKSNTNVTTLVALGVKILAQKYDTEYSGYVWERPDEIKEREKEIDSFWGELTTHSDEKKRVLDDSLAREQFRERVRIMNLDHNAKYQDLVSWIAEKEEYLKAREEVNSVSAAEMYLSFWEGYESDKKMKTDSDIPLLKALGNEILDQKYETEYSRYVWEDPEEIKRRAQFTDDKWKVLDELSAEKKLVLDDHLAREKFKDGVRNMDVNHLQKKEDLISWIKEKEAYLKKHLCAKGDAVVCLGCPGDCPKEEIQSVPEARTQIGLLQLYDNEKKMMTETSVSQLKGLGADILKQHYKTEYSEWKWETPEEIQAREKEIDSWWEELTSLHDKKKKHLDDHLSREQFRAVVKVMVLSHISKYDQLMVWIRQKEEYLKERESIDTVMLALQHLSLFDIYSKDKEAKLLADVAQLQEKGKEVLAQKYSTEYSEYVWERPEDVHNREKEVDNSFLSLDELATAKKSVLDDHKSREEFKAAVRVKNLGHKSKHESLFAWIKRSEAYLLVHSCAKGQGVVCVAHEEKEEVEEIDSIPKATQALSILEVYEQDKGEKTSGDVPQLKSQGEHILSQHYQSEHSEWKWETPEEIKDREKEVDDWWEKLSVLSAAKKLVLEDHAEREEFREKVRLMVLGHGRDKGEIDVWVNKNSDYLKMRETIDSVASAEAQLALHGAYLEDKKTMTDGSVKHLKELGKEILAQQYETEYSLYSYHDPDEITSREGGVEKSWTELDTFSQEKKKFLDDALDLERRKEAKRLEFAHLAREMSSWFKEKTEGMELEHFGFTLAECLQHGSFVEKSKADMNSQAQEKINQCTEVDKAAKELGVVENKYTDFTVDSLSSRFSEFLKAIDERGARYQKELDRQKANDALCKQFADVVNPLSKWISDQKDQVSKSKAELEDQLKGMESRVSTLSADAEKLGMGKLSQMAKEMEEKGITYNLHSSLSEKDIQVQWEQWGAFLERKKSMLSDEIEHLKMRGITHEQLAEIKDNFDTFDADKSGSIDGKELRACLYSLGEEKKPAEIGSLLKEFGDGKTVPYQGFLEFMITVYGDSDTKEEILDSFKLLNKGPHPKGEGIADFENLELVMNEADLKYFKETAPNVSDAAYDYSKWCDDVFSR